MGMLSALTDPLLLAVLLRLPPDDLLSLGCCCAGLRHLAAESLLWRRLYVFRWPAGPADADAEVASWQQAYIDRDAAEGAEALAKAPLGLEGIVRQARVGGRCTRWHAHAPTHLHQHNNPGAVRTSAPHLACRRPLQMATAKRSESVPMRADDADAAWLRPPPDSAPASARRAEAARAAAFRAQRGLPEPAPGERMEHACTGGQCAWVQLGAEAWCAARPRRWAPAPAACLGLLETAAPAARTAACTSRRILPTPPWAHFQDLCHIWLCAPLR